MYIHLLTFIKLVELRVLERLKSGEAITTIALNGLNDTINIQVNNPPPPPSPHKHPLMMS